MASVFLVLVSSFLLIAKNSVFFIMLFNRSSLCLSARQMEARKYNAQGAKRTGGLEIRPVLVRVLERSTTCQLNEEWAEDEDDDDNDS